MGSEPKETFAFMDSGHPLSRQASVSVDDCVSRIWGSLDHATLPDLLLEGTTHHLYQQKALELARHLLPNIHAICVVRRPADRILSSFMYSRQNLGRVDPSLTFDEYVDYLLLGQLAEIQRRVWHPGSSYVLARELEQSSYIEHLSKWHMVLGANRLTVVIAEELYSKPHDTMRMLTTRLGVSGEFWDTYCFARHNETRVVGSHRLQSLAVLLNRYLPRSGNRLKGWLTKAYYALQRKISSPGVEDHQAALLRLDDYFEPSVSALEQFVGIDIAAWRVPRR